jgi:hypothetical protein
VNIDGATINAVTGVLTTDTEVLVVADESRDPMPPNAYALGIAFTATLVVAAVLGETGRWAAGGVGLALMAAAVGVSAWWCRPRVSLCAGALGWLMFNGFVVDEYGALGWHGRSDAVRLGMLLAIAVVTSLARAIRVAMTRRIVIAELAPATSTPKIPHQHKISRQNRGSHA